MGTLRLRLLHISDLHQRTGEDWRRRRVLGDAWTKNLDAIVARGAIDLVCFTGDVADTGKPDEYARAGEFLDALLRRLGLGWERLFVVPGNHDIDRTIAADAWKRLRDDISQHAADRIAAWLAGREAPLGIRDADRDAVLSRQAAYRQWLLNIGRTGLLPHVDLHPNLGYREMIRLPGRPFELHLIGLDSAWLAGDKNDAGKLRLTDEQVMRLATTPTPAGDPLPGLRLALVHHPLDHLADGSECRRLLAERIDILLSGHLHDLEPSLWADPVRALQRVATGSLYGHDNYPNECHVIDIECDFAGRLQAIHFWFRSWSPRGHWFDDDGLYANTRGGQLTILPVPRSTDQPAHPSVGEGHLFIQKGLDPDALSDRVLSLIDDGISAIKFTYADRVEPPHVVGPLHLLREALWHLHLSRQMPHSLHHPIRIRVIDVDPDSLRQFFSEPSPGLTSCEAIIGL